MMSVKFGRFLIWSENERRFEEERQKRKTQELIEKMKLKEISKRKEENDKRS